MAAGGDPENNVIKRALGSWKPSKPPFVLRLFRWLPFLSRIPARIIGMGFLPEHIDKAVIS